MPDNKFQTVVKRLLSTPPKPHVKAKINAKKQPATQRAATGRSKARSPKPA